MTDWYNWLTQSRFDGMSESQTDNSINFLYYIRDLILSNSKIKKNSTVLDLGCGLGLLGIKVIEALNGSGTVILLDSDKKCIEKCEELLKNKKIYSGYKLIVSDCIKMPIDSCSVDNIVIRSVLSHIDQKEKLINECYRIMKKSAHFAAVEPLISDNTRYWQLLSPEKITNFDKFKEIENKIWNDKKDSLLNYNIETLNKIFQSVGFSKLNIKKILVPMDIMVDNEMIQNWFLSKPSPDKPNLKERFLNYIDLNEFERYINQINESLANSRLKLNSSFVLINAEK